MANKRYTEVAVNITVDFTGWATDCSIEEAEKLAIKSLTDDIEGHLVINVDTESLGNEILGNESLGKEILGIEFLVSLN